MYTTITSDYSIAGVTKVLTNADGVSEDIYQGGLVYKYTGQSVTGQTMYFSKLNTKNLATPIYATEFGTQNDYGTFSDFYLDTANNVAIITGYVGVSTSFYLFKADGSTSALTSKYTGLSFVAYLNMTSGSILNILRFGASLKPAYATAIQKNPLDGMLLIAGWTYNGTYLITNGFVARVNSTTTGSSATFTYQYVNDAAYAMMPSNTTGSYYVAGSADDGTLGGYFASGLSQFSYSTSGYALKFETAFGDDYADYVYNIAYNQFTNTVITVGATYGNVFGINAGLTDVLYA